MISAKNAVTNNTATIQGTTRIVATIALLSRCLGLLLQPLSIIVPVTEIVITHQMDVVVQASVVSALKPLFIIVPVTGIVITHMDVVLQVSVVAATQRPHLRLLLQPLSIIVTVTGIVITHMGVVLQVSVVAATQRPHQDQLLWNIVTGTVIVLTIRVTQIIAVTQGTVAVAIQHTGQDVTATTIAMKGVVPQIESVRSQLVRYRFLRGLFH